MTRSSHLFPGNDDEMGPQKREVPGWGSKKNSLCVSRVGRVRSAIDSENICKLRSNRLPDLNYSD